MNPMTEVGFTGSREKPTAEQHTWLLNLLANTEITRIHHGDCIGADLLVHKLCEQLGIPVLIHPPTNPRYRAFCVGPEVVPKPYLERNQDIVNVTSWLIAVPHEEEYARSGTWSTIRYARSLKRQIAIAPIAKDVWPPPYPTASCWEKHGHRAHQWHNPNNDNFLCPGILPKGL